MLMGLDSKSSISGFRIAPRTILREEFVGVGLSLAKLPLCYKSFRQEIGRDTHLARGPRFVSCVKTLWFSIASSKHVESRCGDLRTWETACGLCLLPIPTATGWSLRARLTRQKKASWKSSQPHTL